LIIEFGELCLAYDFEIRMAAVVYFIIQFMELQRII